jgi:uncharacterized hydantoinase/oxoprolinase family protein
MKDKDIKRIIKEALTKTDENKIGVMIRKEIKDAFGNDLERKVKDIVSKELKGKPFEKEVVSKELKGKPFEKEVVKISKDVLEQLYRELWMRRAMWKAAIK